MITFTCPCGKQLAAKDEHAGKQTACPACGERLPIPAADQGDAPLPAAAGNAAPPPISSRDSTAQDFDAAGVAPPRRDDDDDIEDRADRPRRRAEDDEDDAPRSGRGRRRDYEDDEWDDDHDRPRRRKRSTGATSAAAVTSLVAGILSFFCFGLLLIPNIVAVITGIVGLIAAGQGKKGSGMAIAGLVCGIASTLLCAPISIALLLPAVQKVRQAAALTQSANNLKQIGIAFHSYNDAYKRLPTAATFAPNGQPLLSWRVALLPFLEQDHLYRQFKLNEPWDSPHNIRLLDQMPAVYHSPLSIGDKKSLTHYQAFVSRDNRSPGPIFRQHKDFATAIQQIPDGSSNTVLVAEASNPVPWTKPEDIEFPWLGGMPAMGINGGDFNVLMADGSVFRKNFQRMSPESLRLAVIMDDGQPVPADWFH